MFWGLVLQPGKRYSSTVRESFHLSTAVVDTKSVGKNDNGVFPVQVEVDSQELVLCNLSNQCLQMNLDLVFDRGSELTFMTSGKAIIHLTGYTMPDDDLADGSSSDGSEESSELEVSKKSAKPKTQSMDAMERIEKKISEKRKSDLKEAVAAKKAKVIEEKSSEEENSDLEFDDSDLGDLSLSDEAEEIEEEENDDDGDDDEEEDEDSSAFTDSDDSIIVPTKKQDAQPMLKSSKKSLISEKKQNKTPGSNKKQNDKLNKSNSQHLTNGMTPKSDKKEKKKSLPKAEAKTPNNNESIPSTPLSSKKQTPMSSKKQTPPSSKKQTMEGGVVVEELKSGNGPVAKPGKMVAVYYTGRLKNNNRVFDQSNTGPGFKFRLGRGEVIKGWDVALNGMKVGSKRRITCPPSMAYGAKGSAPSIPPNSSLVFDVELKSVN